MAARPLRVLVHMSLGLWAAVVVGWMAWFRITAHSGCCAEFGDLLMLMFAWGAGCFVATAAWFVLGISMLSERELTWQDWLEAALIVVFFTTVIAFAAMTAGGLWPMGSVSPMAFVACTVGFVVGMAGLIAGHRQPVSVLARPLPHGALLVLAFATATSLAHLLLLSACQRGYQP